MKFESLKDKCLYYRSLTDYKLTPNSYVMAMVDGHRFSKMIKNRFERPFSKDFINIMDRTAEYLCGEIQGAKTAYVQSDEISVLITDFDTPMTDSYFGYRLCKMQSLIASMATAMFNREYHRIESVLDDVPMCVFDCKVWTVPNANDAWAWFLYRQTDCIKNSKAQAAQTYLPHKDLLNLNADEMVGLLKERKGIDWNDYASGMKYGRTVMKHERPMEKDLPDGRHIEYMRSVWEAGQAHDFKENDEFRKMILSYDNRN